MPRIAKQALPLAEAASAISFFCGGIMFGCGNSGLMGVFGSCQENANQNAQNIDKMGKYAISLSDNIQELAISTDSKFFRVS